MSVTFPELDLPPVDAPIVRRRSIVVALMGLVVFGAGCATGAAVAVNYYFNKSRSEVTTTPVDPTTDNGELSDRSKEFVKGIVEGVSGDLELSEGQKESVHKAVTQWFIENNRIREDFHKRFGDQREKMEAEISASLNPAQREKYEEKVKKMRPFAGPPGWGGRGKDRRDRKDGERRDGERKVGERKEGERWRPQRDGKSPSKSSADANPAETKPIEGKPAENDAATTDPSSKNGSK